MKGDKLHIHIQNARDSAPPFIANEDHVAALLRDNPDLAEQLVVTIGSSATDPVEGWTARDLAEYHQNIATADMMVGYSFPTADIATAAPNLRLIHFISSGVDHLDPFDWVPDTLALTNNRGVHLEKSGESFKMFLLMLNAQIPRMVTGQQHRMWDRAFTSVIKGRTLCILGVGHQGGEMARVGKSLGMKVIGIDPYVEREPSCDIVVPTSEMASVLPGCDIFAICAPLTDETRGLVDASVLDLLPARAGVINVGRGPILDQSALSQRLRDGRLSGAILDVFDPEPLPADHFLYDTPNLIMTPHVSSDDSVYYMPYTLQLALDNLRLLLEDKPLKNVVDTKLAF